MVIASPQIIVASPQIQPTTVPSPIASLQCQEIGVNASVFLGSQYLTDVTDPHLQTIPLTFTIPELSSTFHDHTMLQSGVMQPPTPDSPMTQFLKSSSSSSNVYTCLGNNMSDLFNFSGMNFCSPLSAESGPYFGMDQYWETNTPSSSLSDKMAPLDLMPISNTLDTLPLPAAYQLLPASSHQNNPMPTITDGSMVPNSARSMLNTATNTLPSVSDRTSKEDYTSRKHKTYKQNTHCILLEGSCHERKKSCKSAKDENTPGLKKQNVNKEGEKAKGRSSNTI